jgi:hypothetical protein
VALALGAGDLGSLLDGGADGFTNVLAFLGIQPIG